jgi:hypothetical protein
LRVQSKVATSKLEVHRRNEVQSLHHQDKKVSRIGL